MSTKRYSIRKTPNFWPVDLPIILWYRSQLSAKDEKDIFQILKNPARICEIDIDMTSVLLEKCASLLEESFPALECLRLGSEGPANGEALVLPDYFLDSSAPRLRVVRLQNTIFPSLPRLLSTSPNLVSLRLENIPARGIFTAQELAIGLSPATQLESLKINIHGAPYHRQIRPLSEQNGLEPRSVLPALFEFEYEGETLYLDDFASRIDIPNVEQIEATLVNNYDVCLTYGLYGLLARVEDLGSSCHHATHIRFFEETVIFEHHFIRSTTSSPVLFRVRLLNAVFLHDDISFVRSIFSAFQFVGIMHKVARVEIEGFPAPSRWEVEADVDSWLSLFSSISGVKRLHVVGSLVSSLVSALVDISAEERTVAKLLPALRDLHLPDEPGYSADIEPFLAARRSCGRPLSVHYKGLRLHWHDE